MRKFMSSATCHASATPHGRAKPDTARDADGSALKPDKWTVGQGTAAVGAAGQLSQVSRPRLHPC